MTKKGGVIVEEDCKVIRGRSKIFIGKQEDNDVLSLHPHPSPVDSVVVVLAVEVMRVRVRVEDYPVRGSGRQIATTPHPSSFQMYPISPDC